tara:strand:+ start:1491 stop:1676 length:186 start_codon:yes stop_codon:yes gene_type:complete
MELLIILVFFIFIILNSKIVEGSIFSKIKKAIKKVKMVNKKKKEGTKTAKDTMNNVEDAQK